MAGIIKAPFTPEQVIVLLKWQEGLGHPLTCCGHDGCTRPVELEDGILIPSENGLTCPCGKYIQDWVPDFLLVEPLRITDPPGKSVSKKVIDLLRLAGDKGYPKLYEYFDPFEIKSWRQDEHEYCAVVCASIRLWLHMTHAIDVWVEPIAPGRYACGIHSAAYTWWSIGMYPPGDYSDLFIKGLEYAINNMLDDGKTNHKWNY